MNIEAQYALPKRKVTIAGQTFFEGTPIPLACPYTQGDQAIVLDIDGRQFTDGASAFEIRFEHELECEEAE